MVEGQFRSDLYYRLRVIEILLPPLRDRGEDITKLAHYMLDKICKRLNRPSLSFSPEALELIRHYHWPGNVREMENAIERAVILTECSVLSPELLAIVPSSRLPEFLPTHQQRSPEMSLDDYFRHFVISNQERLTETELANRLGISRKSLWERRQRLGIPKPDRKS